MSGFRDMNARFRSGMLARSVRPRQSGFHGVCVAIEVDIKLDCPAPSFGCTR